MARPSDTPPPPDSMVIRSIEREDLAAVATLHLRAFPRAALSKLGHEAVRRYYEWQLLGPHDVVALGAFSRSKLVGFCFGGVFRGATAGFVRENLGFLIRRLFRRPSLLADPLFRDRVWLGAQVLRRSLLAKDRSVEASTKATFGILSIAVDPGHQRSGVGIVIMDQMEQHARDSNAEGMQLSVEHSNSAAISFYERLGWQTVDHGARLDRMAKDLRGPHDP